jgi:DNA polymerase IV
MIEQESKSAQRKIIHVDMDAFYASVEQLDNPALKGKPVAVGGSKERGVVAAASYEARKFGVRSAMPSTTAYHKCPSIIFVKPRFERYKEISDIIRAIFHEYTDLVEPLSLDEAFLDVTSNKKGISSATLIAKAIRADIFEQTGLTASAGISVNKFLAKIGSDYNKPDGITLIGPEKVIEFLEQLKIEEFFGVGKVTAEKMNKNGIYTGKDLKQWSEEALRILFGKSGGYYYGIVRGHDNRAVNPNRIRKSLGAENTFSYDLIEVVDMRMKLEPIGREVMKRITKSEAYGKTLTLKIKFKDFTQITRSKTVTSTINNYDLLMDTTYELLEQVKWNEFPEGVRLLGITCSNFENDIEEKEPKQSMQLTINF